MSYIGGILIAILGFIYLNGVWLELGATPWTAFKGSASILASIAGFGIACTWRPKP